MKRLGEIQRLDEIQKSGSRIHHYSLVQDLHNVHYFIDF